MHLGTAAQGEAVNTGQIRESESAARKQAGALHAAHQARKCRTEDAPNSPERQHIAKCAQHERKCAAKSGSRPRAQDAWRAAPLAAATGAPQSTGGAERARAKGMTSARAPVPHGACCSARGHARIVACALYTCVHAENCEHVCGARAHVATWIRSALQAGHITCDTGSRQLSHVQSG